MFNFYRFVFGTLKWDKEISACIII
jgi:hypothetical protein